MTLTNEQLQALEGHTPGPWKSCHCPTTIGWYTIHEPKGRLAIVIGVNDHETPEDKANAALIAAAPDLLAEVKRLNAVIEGNYSAYFRAHSQRDKLVCVLEGILKSAGYTKGEALPQLLELNVGRTYLDDARAALKEVTP